jgi:hypothetical protein
MTANKILKRIAKIEALISKVAQRSSASMPHLRELLQAAKAAVSRVKEAASSRTSSGTAKNSALKHSEPESFAAPQPPKAKRKLSAAGREAIIAATKKRWALKRAEASKAEQEATKKATSKKAVAKSAPSKAAQNPVKKAAPEIVVKKPAVKKSAPAKTAKAQVKKAAKKSAPATAQSKAGGPASTPEVAV